MGKYTMDDIDAFLVDYFGALNNEPEDWMLNIPLVGRKVYEKVALENIKRDVFENAYNKAKNGSAEEQEKFIADMTPVLDDYYSNKKTRQK